MVVSGYSHLWESKQHYRTWIICKKRHVDPSFCLLLLLLVLFLWTFLKKLS